MVGALRELDGITQPGWKGICCKLAQCCLIVGSDPDRRELVFIFSRASQISSVITGQFLFLLNKFLHIWKRKSISGQACNRKNVR